MTTLILRTATRPLTALLIVFAVYMLLRGHDHPGGGFIGGLVAGGAFGLYVMVYGPNDARRAMMIDPRTLVAVGLLLAVGAGLAALAVGRGYLKQYFFDVVVPVIGPVHLSTALLFDIGVFLVVAGMVATVLVRLMEGE